MSRALVLTLILIGIVLQGTRSAAATSVSDYHRASAAIDALDRAGARLSSAAADGLASPRRAALDVYGQIVVTEASLEYFISKAAQLVNGDISNDLQQLSRDLEELKALKRAKADLLGQNGGEAQSTAFTRALAVGDAVVETADHLRASRGCLVCDVTP